MKIWKTDAGLDGVPDDVRTIHDLLDAAFRSTGEEMPRMVAVAKCETDADQQIYETFFELAPGVALSTTYGLPENIQGTAFPTWEAPLAAEEAELSIRSYMALGVSRLSDLLHELRLSVRRTLAASSRGGGSGRLVELWLTDCGGYVHGQHHLKVRVEGIDAHLRPTIEELHLQHMETFDDDIARWSKVMAKRYAAQRDLALQGASGAIDLLTLNAVSTFADTQAWIQSLGRPGFPASPLNVTVFGEDGRFRSHGKDTTSDLAWNRDKVTYPVLVPATVLIACTGRPITDLIQHPMLTDEMIIRDASCTVDGDEPLLTVSIEQPRLLFCTNSGRTWRGR